MAASTIIKVRAFVSENPLAVVARYTALRARIRKMLYGYTRANLPGLWQSRSAHIVTTIAVQPLARAVISVAKTHAVGASRTGGW